MISWAGLRAEVDDVDHVTHERAAAHLFRTFAEQVGGGFGATCDAASVIEHKAGIRRSRSDSDPGGERFDLDRPLVLGRHEANQQIRHRPSEHLTDLAGIRAYAPLFPGFHQPASIPSPAGT